MYEEHLWVMDNFPESIRYESVIIEDENVLSANSINAVSVELFNYLFVIA